MAAAPIRRSRPMWTAENRARYDRSKRRYPSDLTHEEWALAKAEIPRARRGGNKRTVDVREVMNGLMYVLSTGCQWRAIPKDLPPRSTVNHYFCRWRHDGTLDRLHHALYVLCREQANRGASPSRASARCCPTCRRSSTCAGAARRAGSRWASSTSACGMRMRRRIRRRVKSCCIPGGRARRSS